MAFWPCIKMSYEKYSHQRYLFMYIYLSLYIYTSALDMVSWPRIKTSHKRVCVRERESASERARARESASERERERDR